MAWVKKLWFPVAATVLVVIIGVNVYKIFDYRISSSNQTGQNVASQGSATRDNPAGTDTAVPDLVSRPGPRDIVFRLKPTNGEANRDGQKLTAALEALGPVKQASFEDDIVNLAIASSLRVSELVERLGSQETALVEDELPLRGGLRLHVSGMTCQGCASALKEQLSGLEGAEVKDPIDLRSVEEGYAQLSVAESSGLTLGKLKEAIKNTPFELEDVQWLIRSGKASD